MFFYRNLKIANFVSVKDLHSNSKSIQYAIEGDVITAVLNDVLESQLSYGDLLLKRY